MYRQFFWNLTQILDTENQAFRTASHMMPVFYTTTQVFVLKKKLLVQQVTRCKNPPTPRRVSIG